MYDPVNNIFNVKSPILWVDFCFSILLIALLSFVLYKIHNSKKSLIAVIAISLVTLISWFFGLKFVWAISLLLLISLGTITAVHNQNEFRDIIGTFKKKRKNETEKVYDRHAVCQKISVAVETLSRTKTGALITFEKGMKLNDVVKTGTMLHAPITPELLVTIFYPGTRLHDGAVVIRRDEILAASVYYTPTTRPLTGKFGSRHRAGIGISEITDAVTVIVSEETGRISITYKGELIPVQQDNLLRTLEDYLINEPDEGSEEEEAK
ncbi:MAG: DNA integrity scanning protein DisA nucleotide-binding domain protein [Firmicutes bacterium]|nr:DNA integrity scanning protein DisA nucleotide-binding domain protein [Candidatus Fiminaster equi]